MCCFVILLLSNEMQISVRRFSAIPHLRDVVDDCRQCIQKSLPRILPRVVFKCTGQWTINWNNNLRSRSFVSNYFDHFK